MCSLGLVAALTLASPVEEGPWPQFGGPSRDFVAADAELKENWPESGPPVVWKRALGPGYSSIVGDGERLFTMYRPGDDEEAVIALDAATGKTLWEERFSSPTSLGSDTDETTEGPNSTPYLFGERIYSVGTTAVARCLDKSTGKLVWSRDLQADFACPRMVGNGYSVSPLVYEHTLIVPIGTRPEQGIAPDEAMSRSVLALDLDDGSLVWSSRPYVVWQSSPKLIRHGGADQIVLLMNDAIAAIDPKTGDELWSLPFDRTDLHNITPLWNGRDLLVFAPGGPGAMRGVRLTLEGGKTVPEIAWVNRKMMSMIYVGVQDGDHAYLTGSNGVYGYDLGTGKQHWKERGFNTPSCILAGDKLVLLDSSGELVLATPSKEGLAIHARAQVAGEDAVTSPALVGSTLYVRDRAIIMALELGK